MVWTYLNFIEYASVWYGHNQVAKDLLDPESDRTLRAVLVGHEFPRLSRAVHHCFSNASRLNIPVLMVVSLLLIWVCG